MLATSLARPPYHRNRDAVDKKPATLAGLTMALLCLSTAPLFVKTYVNFGSLALDFTCGPEQTAVRCGGTVLAAASPFLLAVSGTASCIFLARQQRAGLCLAAGAGALAMAWGVALCFVLMSW